MPPGINGSGNLNIIVFEVGVQKDEEGGLLGGLIGGAVRTISVHPLLVVPESIRWSDASRTSVQQTYDASIYTPGGRALRTCSLQGSFGIESRGIGYYIGNGDTRFRRFYDEVIRMGDALSQVQVDAARGMDGVLGALGGDFLIETPLLGLVLKLNYTDGDPFFINMFDFWHDRQMQVLIRRFDTTRQAGQGGASGLVRYTMEIQEVGPVVAGGLGGSIIALLMAGLTLWNDINNLLKSYTLEALTQGVSYFGQLVQTQIDQTRAAWEAWNDTSDDVTSLMAGSARSTAASRPSSSSSSGSSSSSSGRELGARTSGGAQAVQRLPGGTTSTPLASVNPQQTEAAPPPARFLAAVESAIRGHRQIADTLETRLPANFRPNVGYIDWPNADRPDFVTRWEKLRDLRESEDAFRFQLAAGAYFGMDRSTYRDYILSGGHQAYARPEIGGTYTHTVTATDLPQVIERTYGVSWQRILALNRLTPHEALQEGRALLIPRVRARAGQVRIEGLPTLGSHVGQAAWGVDLPIELIADANGDLATVSGPDVLRQGAEIVVSMAAGELLKPLELIPDAARGLYLQKKLAAILTTDPRFENAEVEAPEVLDTAIQIVARVRAINGGDVAVEASL